MIKMILKELKTGKVVINKGDIELIGHYDEGLHGEPPTNFLLMLAYLCYKGRDSIKRVIDNYPIVADILYHDGYYYSYFTLKGTDMMHFLVRSREGSNIELLLNEVTTNN